MRSLVLAACLVGTLLCVMGPSVEGSKAGLSRGLKRELVMRALLEARRPKKGGRKAGKKGSETEGMGGDSLGGTGGGSSMGGTGGGSSMGGTGGGSSMGGTGGGSSMGGTGGGSSMGGTGGGSSMGGTGGGSSMGGTGGGSMGGMDGFEAALGEMMAYGMMGGDMGDMGDMMGDMGDMGDMMGDMGDMMGDWDPMWEIRDFCHREETTMEDEEPFVKRQDDAISALICPLLDHLDAGFEEVHKKERLCQLPDNLADATDEDFQNCVGALTKAIDDAVETGGEEVHDIFFKVEEMVIELFYGLKFARDREQEEVVELRGLLKKALRKI